MAAEGRAEREAGVRYTLERADSEQLERLRALPLPLSRSEVAVLVAVRVFAMKVGGGGKSLDFEPFVLAFP